MLNTFPEWALVVLFVGVALLLAFGGLYLVRRHAPSWRDESSSQVVLGVTAIVMTLFALLLALVVVDLHTSYRDASNGVGDEANSLNRIEQDADAFPAARKAAVERAVANYIVEVRKNEFPALREGREDQKAEKRLLQISTALRRYSPRTQAQIAFYDSALSRIDDLVSERQSRIGAAESSVPPTLIALVLVLGVLSIGTSLFVKTHHSSLDLILVGSLAAVVGLALATVLVLEYPFSGSIAVSSDPLVRGPLGHLVHQYR